jgi:hypothetical protein
VALAACTTSGLQTSWAKAGVSKADYGTDIGMCTGLAAQAGGGNGANTAGGVQGQNNPVQIGDRAAGAGPGPNGQSPPATDAAKSSNLPAGGTYSGMASSDYAQRAATQQRTQEMMVKRARADTLKGCLTERGYREITLSAEQRAHLATLKAGSNEYHEYLYKIGSDPAVGAVSAR